MGDENKNFDLVSLIRMGDVDVHRVIRNNPAVRVTDLMYLLQKFENQVPKGRDALGRIASLEADGSDLNVLTETASSLTEIGCTKLIPAFEEIVKVGTRGRASYAAENAKKALDDFDRLCTRIMSAKKAAATIDDTGGNNISAGDFSKKSLKEAIVLLEKQEATRKLRILAIDDAPVMIKTISAVLNTEYKVYGMTDPTMVEKFLEQITPDLFLLDYQMPKINGFELIPVIRKFEEHKDTPIIFLTSLGTVDYVSSALALGARDFIVKPFQSDNLLEKVGRHIVRRKLIQGGA